MDLWVKPEGVAGFTLCPPTAEWSEAATLRPDVRAKPCCPSPPRANRHAPRHTHTHTYVFSQTNQEQTMMAQWPTNHGPAGIIHKLLNQIPLKVSCSSDAGGRGGESPPQPTTPHPTLSLAHSNTPLFNELITKDAQAEQYGFVTNTLYIVWQSTSWLLRRDRRHGEWCKSGNPWANSYK